MKPFKGDDIIASIKCTWNKLISKLNVVSRDNEQVAIESLKSNLDRIYFTAIVIAPVQLLIALVFLLKGSLPIATEELWRISVFYANLSLFVGTLLIWLVARKIRKTEHTKKQLLLFQNIVIIFVLISGITVTIIDQLVTPNITPLMISFIIVGTFYFVRPKVAAITYTLAFLVYSIALSSVGIPKNIFVSNMVNGLLAVVIGFNLSIVSWRNFVTSALQTEKILAQQAQLEQMAYKDPLTGLPNRRFLDEVIKREVALVKRGARESCVIMLDIDDFKEVNDTYGHPTGDEVLKQLADLLQKNIRESDTLVRLGGEEFIILLSNTPATGGLIVAEKIRAIIRNQDFRVSKDVIRVTASFGVAPLLNSDQDYNYYSIVDKALYMAKASGKNQIASAMEYFETEQTTHN